MKLSGSIDLVEISVIIVGDKNLLREIESVTFAMALKTLFMVLSAN